MRRYLIVLCAMLALAASAAPRAEIIDRVLAAVNASVITLSDVEAVQRFGLIDVRGDRGAVLERLIERNLTLAEVNRYAPPEPADGVVDARMADVRRRFGSDERFAAALAEVGISEAQLRAYVRDDLRIRAYLTQRFGAALQPAEADILEYYRTHPSEFTRDGVLLSYPEAHDDARAGLIAERRAALVRDWLAGLRRRADITVPAVLRR